jgi:hypothetical protein
MNAFGLVARGMYLTSEIIEDIKISEDLRRSTLRMGTEFDKSGLSKFSSVSKEINPIRKISFELA